MNIYAGLLFLHGHIADVGLAQRLAEGPDAEAEDAEAAGSAPATHGVALPPVSPHPCG